MALQDVVNEFPEELPEGDRKKWPLLSGAKREKAFARLRAIDEITSQQISVVDAAARTGISVRRMGQILAAWRSEGGSLEALGLYTRNKARDTSRTVQEDRDWIAGIAAEAFGRDPEVMIEKVVKLVVEQAAAAGRPLPSIFTLRRHIAEERRKIKGQKGRVGMRLAIDMSPIRALDERGNPHVVAAVVDDATGFIWGAAVGDFRLVPEVLISAATDARKRLPGVKITGPLADEVMTAQLELWSKGYAEPLWRLMNAENWEKCVEKRSAGTHLQLALGEALGRIPFQPSWLKEKEGSSAWAESPTVPSAQIEDILSGAVELRNSVVLKSRSRSVDRSKRDRLLASIEERLAKIPRSRSF